VLTFKTITLYNNSVNETAYELRWEPEQQRFKTIGIPTYDFLCELCNNKNAPLIIFKLLLRGLRNFRKTKLM